mgnify:CR=1 FL=1
MNIGLLGYGKMGKEIEKLALDRGHKIVLKINSSNINELTHDALQKPEVLIDFSTPRAAKKNIMIAIESKTPIVCGTTGWLNDFEHIVSYCKEKNGSFLYASNFSLGVNLFFELNKNLAKLMKNHNNYGIRMSETHHTEKVDAPSGTAISLAEQIIAENKNKSDWTISEKSTEEKIKIDVHRENNIPGKHMVLYNSDIDSISIQHEAHSRKGFALGAIIAAEWIKNKKGVFNIKDILFPS